MKGKGLGFVIGGAVGMMMSLVWFTMGGVFVASIMKPEKKQQFNGSYYSDNKNYKPRSEE